MSGHQGLVDWRAVAADGIGFAYIKASEGGEFVDDTFARNREQAAAAGLDRGAHHFFTLCRPGADQARNFLATAPPDPDALAPVVDLDRARWQRRLLRRPTGAGWRIWQVHDFAAVGGVDLNVMRRA